MGMLFLIMKPLVILVIFITQYTLGAVHIINGGHSSKGLFWNTISASEYARLPALISLDPFSRCLLVPGDTYCYVDAKLAANETSELLSDMQEYSAYKKTRFDHTLVHRGLCVTQTCAEYNNITTNTDLVYQIEACLNDTLYKSHGLQTKVIADKVLCTTYGEWAGLDAADCAVAALALGLVALALTGSLYDFCHRESNSIGARLLLCFSVRQNWRLLIRSSGNGLEARQRRLKVFTGLKAITTLCVIMGHAPLNSLLATSNPEFIENAYNTIIFCIILCGSLIVQTFFLSSGFLLTYNILLSDEKRKSGWQMLPKFIALRWLRLTPVYAMVLAFVSTWQRHLGSGPLWMIAVEDETLQCQQSWYYNLLYLNNYVDGSYCMLHTWYLGADMQLSVLGLLILCLATSAKARKIGVALAFAVGMLTPAAHTYFQNLNPLLVMAPESVRNMFTTDATFTHLYKRGHTNIMCYAIGMALAMVVYRFQEQDFKIAKYQKYRLLYWATVPLAVALILTGSVFYSDIIEIPAAVRAGYASGVKLVYGLILAVIIYGAIFKLENVYRRVLEWYGWAPLGRLSYAVYLVHYTVIRFSIGTATLLNNTVYQNVIEALGVMCVSFMIAAPLWMLVEAPFGELVKVCFYPRPEGTIEKNPASTTRGLGDSKETVDSNLS